MSVVGSFVGALLALGFRADPLAELEAENKRLKAELEDVKGERDDARRERDAYRQRAGHVVEPLPMGGQHAVNDWRQLGQAAQNVMEQQMAQAQQLMGQQALAQYQVLPQSQAQNWPQQWGHCDCSPSRSLAIIGRP